MSHSSTIFARQAVHAVLLAVLLAAAMVASRLPGFYQGGWLGITTGAWFWSLVAVTVIHQVYVWLCWRLQLHRATLTRLFGRAAFALYTAGFAVLILSRPILIVALSIANRDTVGLPAGVMVSAGVLLLLPAAYLFYSVARYFGFRRALGIDHFDPAYRTLPLVRRGIFRWTDNGMYTYGFLLLWAPAVGLSSIAGLTAATFSHLYIWVHYYCTERPDMRRIYGP